MSNAGKQRTERWALALLFTALLATPVFAQNREDLEKLPELKAKGTIKGLAPGMLQITTTKNNEELIVQVLPNNRSMRFVGSAEPGWLMPGMWVNFTTRFSAKGQALEPVKLMMVFSPGTNRGGDEGQYQPGVKPLTSAGEGISFSGEEKEKLKVKDDSALCEVTGQIQGLGKGTVSVLAAGVPVQVTLAEAASISVDVADLTPARVGDSVEVFGRTVAPGKGIGMRVEVKGATPLTAKVAATEGKSKVPAKETKETKPAATTTAENKLPAAGEKKLPLLGKKPSTPEKKAGLEKKPQTE